MISLGTARLLADGTTHGVFVAITWERDHAWSGIVGAELDWEELRTQTLTLEVPGSLAPSDEGVVTDFVIDAVLDNEVRARGAVTARGPLRERSASEA